ncbi:hypothetical protein PENSPDRAFT_460935 [Peniophora sp. CONT]|nr:hypothetical protein PENSPDRAFT_460935 [Peniophora sp. CONT]
MSLFSYSFTPTIMTTSTQTRKRFWLKQTPVVSTTSRPTCSTAPPDDISSLWDEALDAYKNSLGIDLRDDSTALGEQLARCTSADDIAAALQDTVKKFGDKRKGKKAAQTVRESLKSIVVGLKCLLDIGAEVASASAVPGGKGIFIALSILLQAAERVTARFDSLEKLFQQFQTYLTRLCVRMEGNLGSEARSLVVNALVCMLRAIMLATKIMGEGRIERFVKALFTKTSDVQDIVVELHDIVVEEERLAVAEMVVGMHEISVNLEDLRGTVDRIQDEISTAGRLCDARFDRLEKLVKLNQTPKKPPSIPSRAPDSGVCMRQAATELCSVLSMFNPEDRATVQRALALIYSLAANAVAYSDDHSMESVITTCLNPLQVLATFMPWAFAFVSLFAIWRCIARPLGFAPGRIVLVDVLGKTFVIEDDTFMSWERTHAFLVKNFTDC